MSMAVGGRSGGAKADINVTPLIDVLLVLLIIFMVITPMTPKGLEALVPQPAPPGTAAQAAERPHRRDLDRQGQVDDDQPGRRSTRAACRPRLEEIFKTRAERVVFVKGDPDLEYQTVANAIDIANGAGIDKVGLMTPKVEAGQ